MTLDCLIRDKNAFFESARLRYHGITPDDAAKIVEWRGDRRIYRFFLSRAPVTMEEHLAWFRKYLTDASRFDFMVTEKASGRKVGTVGLQNLSGASADLSYLIDVGSQGLGFGSEAIRAMSAYAFEHFGLQNLSAVILVGNSSSVGAAERAGYRLFSQTYRLERPGKGG